MAARPPMAARRAGAGVGSNAIASAKVKGSEKRMISGSVGAGGYDSDSAPVPTMTAEEMKI